MNNEPDNTDLFDRDMTTAQLVAGFHRQPKPRDVTPRKVVEYDNDDSDINETLHPQL